MSPAFGLTTQIRSNHLKSVFLLAGFPVLLLGMIWAFFTGLDVVIQPPHRPINWVHALAAGNDGVINYGVWAFAAAGLWFFIAYFAHDSIIRATTGAVPVTRAEYPKIYNMLENLCISRGLPMPSFEIIDTPALNAFASGLDQKSFKIVLTRGLVDTLPDDELEAVIGHELTHIINRDVRLLIISVIFVGIISFLLQIVFRSLRFSGRRRDRGNGAIILVALAVLAVGYLLAVVIRFSLSQRREYLADAGSVELTKNPEAMMKALMRISGHDHVDSMPRDLQQMCIENSRDFLSLFATHPPIEARIRAISDMTATPIPASLSPAAAAETSPSPWGSRS